MEIPPPIAASVQHTGGASALSFTDKVSSVFAGGNAAIYAAGDKPGAGGLDAVACVSEDVPGLYHAGHVAPLVFGTDTVIGLHVSLLGATGSRAACCRRASRPLPA
jgi:hypothetical protein